MLQTLKVFRDRRLISVFFFGIASGFPWLMIGSIMTAWLADEGLTRKTIGLFGAIFAVYSFNFLWSPLVDRLRPPVLGQRRGWIITMQCLIAVACVAMSFIDAQSQLYYIAFIGFIIALASATQDIAIDAYRIDIIKAEEKDTFSAASSIATAGWWTGYGGIGAIPFFLVQFTSLQWPDIYLFLATVMSLLMAITLWSKEPDVDRQHIIDTAERIYRDTIGGHSRLKTWLLISVVEPFREFFTRNGVRFAISILLFIFLFKIGEAFLGKMSLVFYKEIGFSDAQIGSLSKLLNWGVTIVFSVIGGMVNIRYGIYRGLMIAGIAMAASNLMFSVIAVVGPNPWLFAATVVVDGFTAAWSTVAMVAFISLMCNKAFSATQYALMASLSGAGRTLISSSSGFLIDDGLDGNWSLFFILTTLMVIPSLLFLYTLKEKITEQEKIVDH